jgi:hypothetical protein
MSNKPIHRTLVPRAGDCAVAAALRATATAELNYRF